MLGTPKNYTEKRKEKQQQTSRTLKMINKNATTNKILIEGPSKSQRT